MRVLVGVLHCIENEYERCLKAIASQTAPPADVFTVSGLRNKAAHERLYDMFMSRSSEADLFVKVDADMVLCRKTFFAECADVFSNTPQLQHLQIALADWMTGRPIYGLHVYRSSHVWVKSGERFFVDMTDGHAERVDDCVQLAPAAVHCPDPSPFQAYRFGLHKAVKFQQKGRENVHVEQRVTHWNHFAALERNYYRAGDRRLGLAVLGFLDALAERWGPDQVDYEAKEPATRFRKYADLSADGVRRAIRRRFPFGRAGISHSFRFELAALVAGGDYGFNTIAQSWRRWRRRAFESEASGKEIPIPSTQSMGLKNSTIHGARTDS